VCVFGTEKIESENHDRMKQHETFLYFVFFSSPYYVGIVVAGYFVFLGLSEYKEEDGKIIEILKKDKNWVFV
jgi:hypothetical protein